MKNKPENHFKRQDFEIYKDIYERTIIQLNEAYNIWMSDYILRKNLVFMEICYNYHWTIWWLDTYLKSKSYIIHSNLWDAKLFWNEIEKQKENIKNWTYLIWFYFRQNSETKVDRYIFWWKSSAVKRFSKKFSDTLNEIIYWVPLPVKP